jgi:DNA transformation protein and related proteins
LLVADHTLYFKADETLFPVFDEREIEPFQYEKHGKIFKMSYYWPPEKIFDDPVEANGWAVRSYAVPVHSKNTVKKVKNPQEDLGFAPWEIGWLDLRLRLP